MDDDVWPKKLPCIMLMADNQKVDYVRAFDVIRVDMKSLNLSNDDANNRAVWRRAIKHDANNRAVWRRVIKHDANNRAAWRRAIKHDANNRAVWRRAIKPKKLIQDAGVPPAHVVSGR